MMSDAEGSRCDGCEKAVVDCTCTDYCDECGNDVEECTCEEATR